MLSREHQVHVSNNWNVASCACIKSLYRYRRTQVKKPHQPKLHELHVAKQFHNFLHFKSNWKANGHAGYSIMTWTMRSLRRCLYRWWCWLTFRRSFPATSFMELTTSSWAWSTLIREALSCIEYSLPIKTNKTNVTSSPPLLIRTE